MDPMYVWDIDKSIAEIAPNDHKVVDSDNKALGELLDFYLSENKCVLTFWRPHKSMNVAWNEPLGLTLDYSGKRIFSFFSKK